MFVCQLRQISRPRPPRGSPEERAQRHWLGLWACGGPLPSRAPHMTDCDPWGGWVGGWVGGAAVSLEALGWPPTGGPFRFFQARTSTPPPHTPPGSRLAGKSAPPTSPPTVGLPAPPRARPASLRACSSSSSSSRSQGGVSEGWHTHRSWNNRPWQRRRLSPPLTSRVLCNCGRVRRVAST